MRTKEGDKEKDIIDAAIKVFAEEGFHNAKISKIADIANVATGTVYVYFKNKEDILYTILNHLWTKLCKDISHISGTDSLSPLEKFDALIDLVIDTFTENPSLAVVFVTEQIHITRSPEVNSNELMENFMGFGESIIQEGISTGVFSNDFDVKFFRDYLLGAIRHLLHNWADDPKNFPLNKIRQNVKYLAKHGITK